MTIVKAGEYLSASELLFIAEDGNAYSYTHLLPPPPPIHHWDMTKKQVHEMLRGFIPPKIGTGLADGAYRITTLSEFLRFWEWSLIWTMKRKKNFKDCDAATRKLKGKLVCEGWAGLVPLDIWYKHANGGRHSEFCTLLVDDSAGPVGYTAEGPLERIEFYHIEHLIKAFLFEPGKRNLYRPCLEYFAPETGRKVYKCSQ